MQNNDWLVAKQPISSPPLSPTFLIDPLKPATLNVPLPLILQQLGEELLTYNAAPPASPLPDVTHIKDIKDSVEISRSLQRVIQLIDELMQANYKENSEAIGLQIQQLDGQVRELETRLQFLQQAGNVSNKQYDDLGKISKTLHHVLVSTSDWLSFRERFFDVDEAMTHSMEEVTASLYAGVQGWNLSAVKEMEASLGQMKTLIEMSKPLLQEHNLFSPDLLTYLESSLYSTLWSCEHWLMQMLQNYEGIVGAAMRVREKDPLYDKQASFMLHVMKEVLTELKKMIPSVAESLSQIQADPIFKERAKAWYDKESPIDKIRKHASRFENYIQSLSQEISQKQRAIDTLLKEKNISIDPNIRFEDETLGNMLALGRKQPGRIARFFQAILPDPENWSATTKRCVYAGLTLLQLSDQFLKIYQQLPVTKGALTPEQSEQINLETAFLGNILSSKLNAIRDPRTFEHFVKKAPGIESTLRALQLSSYQSLSKELQSQIMDHYRTYRQEILLNTGQAIEPSAWIHNLTTREPVKDSVTLLQIGEGGTQNPLVASAKKEELSALPAIEGVGPFIGHSFIREKVLDELKEADFSARAMERQIQTCNRIEFLKPYPSKTPLALLELKNEIKALRQGLLETMAQEPREESPVEWMTWNQAVQRKCYDLREVETRVAKAMSVYQDEMRKIESYVSLDVFGNKHKNLVKQAHVVDALGLEGIHVPMPQGLPSSHVLNFLTAEAPEIFDYWEQLGDLYASYQGEGVFLQMPEVVLLLKKIDAGIEKGFKRAGGDEKVFDLLVTAEFKAWLKIMSAEHKYLMVRSTGAEDSKESANAGGNASLAYVKASQQELSQALGDVVRSYFGAGSLQKRINANLNPFKDALRVAVTAQELIGEELGGSKDPGQIPVSLVLFTNEPLYIGEEKFRAMRISATYGHGEGVVGNRGIATDTALVLISESSPDKLYILYDNQEKPERLAPQRDSTGKVSLEKMANSAERAKRPALSTEIIARLYEWGVIGEKYFEDYPTDMEIVVKGGVVYPVQARPVNRPPLKASYLDLKKVKALPESPVLKTLGQELIVPGQASVVTLNRPEEVLIADTLEKAEGVFIKGQHRLVVVGQPEPANSHPVVNFSALGIPCLYARDLASVQSLMQEVSAQQPLVACVQAGTLSLWDESKGAVEAFTSVGFVTHPAKLAISLLIKGNVLRHAGIPSDAPSSVRGLLSQLGSATDPIEARKTLEALKSEAWISNLKQQIDSLEHKVANIPLAEQAVRPIIESGRLLYQKIEAALTEIEALLGGERRLQLLLQVKTLETLLFQRPVSAGALQQHSLSTFAENIAAAEALLLYQSQLPHRAHFSDLLLDGSQSPVEQVFEKWNGFLLQLEPIAEHSLKNDSGDLSVVEIARFQTVLHTLRKAGVLPLFMTFFFHQMSQEDPIATLRGILDSMPLHEEPIIEQIFAAKKEIAQLKNEIGEVGHPKAYQAIFERLKNLVEGYIPSSQPWLKNANWLKASPVTRSIALQTMDELVDLYDTAIKSMKASTEINDTDKVRQFKEMLQPYLRLLQEWVLGTVGAQEYRTHRQWPVPIYLEQIQSILNGRSDSQLSQLRPSRDFSVSAAILGSTTAFDRHLPNTLEDVFTLIHQNLLISISTLVWWMIGLDESASFLPGNLLSAIAQTEKIRDATGPIARLIGIDIRKEAMILHYNVPLRNHAARFDLHFDRASGKVNLVAHFLGEARERWDKGAEMVSILNGVGLIDLKTSPKVTPQEFAYTCELSSKIHSDFAFNEFQRISELSMGETLRIEESFVNTIEREQKIGEAAAYVAKENLRSWFSKALVDRYVNQALIDRSNPILLSKNFIETLWVSSHPLFSSLRTALKVYLLGTSKNEAIQQIPLEDREIVTNYLDILAEEVHSDFFYSLMNNQQDCREIWEVLLSEKREFSQAIKAAKEGLKNNNRDVRYMALTLLSQLVERGQGFFEAMVAAKEGVKDGDPDFRMKAFDLWGKLVEQGQAFPEAISAAKEGAKRGDPDLRASAFDLWGKLIEQRQAFPEAISAAKESLKDEHQAVRESALNLWNKFFQQRQGFPEAIFAAKESLKDEHQAVRANALNLWSKLFEHRQGFSDAIATAKEGLKDERQAVRESAIDLWSNLVEQRQAFPEAIFAAKERLKDENQFVRERAFDLWIKLVEQEQGFPEAISAAKEGFKDGDSRVRVGACALWSKLAEQGQGFPEAISVAKKGLYDRSAIVRESAIKLWIKLVEKGQGFPEAISAAKKGIKDGFQFVQESAFDLWIKLVEQGQAFPEAISVAKEGLNAIGVGKKVNDLRSKLVEQGHWDNS